MGQAQINVRTRACSRTSIARTKQAALTHNVRGKELRTDTTREFFFKRKLINYTKNELQGINILKLRLPNGLKCCLNFFYCRNG